LSGRTLTTPQIVEEPNLDKILQSYIGFCDLKRLRTSLDYSQGLRKKLFVMIRQLGPLTFFYYIDKCTTFMDPLLRTLYELNANALKLLDFHSLESIHTTKLIRLDPMTCALYYNHRSAAFRKLIRKEASIIREVIDVFSVIEFQERGSEHDHAIIWIKNAPRFQINSNKEIEAFVDKYISSDNIHLLQAL